MSSILSFAIELFKTSLAAGVLSTTCYGTLRLLGAF